MVDCEGCCDGSATRGRYQMGDLQLHHVVCAEKSGLRFLCSPSLRLWETIGRQIVAIADSSAWWIADWLVYGEDTFQDRYKEVIKGTDLNYQTLRNYAWVARRFELARRREALSFAHHAEVAALAQLGQDHWLDRAEEHGWSRNQLRGEIRDARELDAASDVKGGTIRLPLTVNQAVLFEAAANARHMPVQEWASEVLADVAQQLAPRNGADVPPAGHQHPVRHAAVRARMKTPAR